ncbi:MAG: c-type cytochrome [Chloroflexi bacterium]|nr:c-type cytochrome [Chloroflexota bacterium]MCY3938790.1 c-type cytochrome [Chloroflexota bacterium]
MRLGSWSFSRKLTVRTALAFLAVSMAVIAACGDGGRETSGLESAPPPSGAATKPGATPSHQVDSDAAIALFKSKGCIACHVVSSIPEAVGTIGPRLEGLASRNELAAGLPVTADNIARWIRDPAEVKPGTVMPKLVQDEAEIEILVAWLLTLR